MENHHLITKNGIFTRGERSDELRKLEFPVISISEDLIDKSDQIKFIKEDVFEKCFKKKSGLIGWLKSYRERKG